MREKRAHQRTEYAIPVEVLLPSGETQPAESKDLSIGGVFLLTDRTVGIGTEITLTLELPGLGASTLPGIVRWLKSDGLGVQFGLLGARQTHAVGKLVRELSNA